MANGYEVSEPISPQPYDLIVRRGNDDVRLVQVKTAFTRDEKRYGGKYVVVRGHKRNGDVYTRDEVDYFVAVYDGDVYMFLSRVLYVFWFELVDIAARTMKMGWSIYIIVTRV